MTSIPSLLQALWIIVSFQGNPVMLNTNESMQFHMMTAWNATGQVIRFVPFAASDAQLAKLLSDRPTPLVPGEYYNTDWAPMLLRFFCAPLNDVYFINCGQTVIFSAEPGDPTYSPIWRAHYWEFVDRTKIRPLNTVDEVLAAFAAGELKRVGFDSILDATIVQDSDRNVIPQALSISYANRTIELPLIKVFPKPKITGMTTIWASYYIALTDSSDETLAEQLGANFAPALIQGSETCPNGLDRWDTIDAFVQPTAPDQLPILDQVQSYRPIDGLQINKDYTPVKCWDLFRLPTPPANDTFFPTIKTQQVVNTLVASGAITPVPLVPAIVTNSPSFLLNERDLQR